MESREKNRQGKSVFLTFMRPLLILLLIEALVMLGILTASGVIPQLNRNNENILEKQVQNRSVYLGNLMEKWSDLDMLALTINEETQRMLDAGEITLDTLGSSSDECAPLLLNVVDDMISTLYAKQLSGIFVIFNTDSLPAQGETEQKHAGICIRDLDPNATPSARNEDLLLVRAPIAVVRALNISTDESWEPLFSFPEMRGDYQFADRLRMAGVDNIEDASDYGYWNPKPYSFPGGSDGITYSIPLVLRDGTVYGVVGVELLGDYLRTLMPTEELHREEHGGMYMLLMSDTERDDEGEASVVICAGESTAQPEKLKLTPEHDGCSFTWEDGTEYFAASETIALYNRNAPFEHEVWQLVGAVPKDELYSFSHSVIFLLSLDLLLVVLIGLLGSYLISRMLANPIKRLSGEIAKVKASEGIPELPRTGMLEIDRFSDAFTALSREAVSASTRFLRVIRLTSIEIGGFEIRYDENVVFVTENFFPMLGLKDVKTADMTVAEFEECTEYIKKNCKQLKERDGSLVYKVRTEDGGHRYVRINGTNTPGGRVGVAEDITAAALERKRVENERDYDVLTGLLNRRAFYAQVGMLFKTPETLGHAALLMYDLDNLKYINDHYGHDCGDKYISQAGRRFRDSAPERAKCSRVSGDEFFILIYGYESREELREELKIFAEKIRSNLFQLPNGETMQISASGGVAWYPEDSTDFGQLMKYADFAMYQIKHGRKDGVGEFDLNLYNRASLRKKAREDFYTLLRENRIGYQFQPIVDARTGETAAYEALMRTDLQALHGPGAIIDLAHEEDRLQEIEDLTWLNAPAAYMKLLEEGKVLPEAKLFINSIASVTLSEEAARRFTREFAQIREQIIAEITETDQMTPEIIETKRRHSGGTGVFALDDYGSGYNGERALLDLRPKYIKVDFSIIRDIDKDSAKQHILLNTLSYAHERDVLVVAEGLETEEELKTAIMLGCDMVQGFLLAKPADVPEEIPRHIVELIRSAQEERQKAAH